MCLKIIDKFRNALQLYSYTHPPFDVFQRTHQVLRKPASELRASTCQQSGSSAIIAMFPPEQPQNHGMPNRDSELGSKLSCRIISIAGKRQSWRTVDLPLHMVLEEFFA